MEHINKTLGPALLEKASWRSRLPSPQPPPCDPVPPPRQPNSQYFHLSFILHITWLLRNLTSASSRN